MTTLHANSARDALTKAESLCLLAGIDLPISAIRRQIASAIDLVIQVKRFRTSERRVVAISEVTGMEGETITLQDIFLFEKTGITESGKVVGRFRATGIRPKFYDRLKQSGIVLPTQMFQTVVEIN